MTDKEFMSLPSDRQMDELLKRSFGRNLQLSDGFEDRVMSTIHRKETKSRQHKVIMMVMMVYWAAASMLGAWLLLGGSGNENPEASTGSVVLVVALALIAFGLTFVLRQSRFRLGDLFLQTIR